jgi:hypothetical protein
MMREMAEPTEECMAIVRRHVRPQAELLRDILAGLLPPDTLTEEGDLVAGSIVGQCLFYWMHRPLAAFLAGDESSDRFDVARLAAHIARFSLAALGFARPLGAPPPRQRIPSWLGPT